MDQRELRGAWPVECNLFGFFRKFLSVLTAKASFYFFNAIHQHDSFLQFKPIKSQYDYHTRIKQFVDLSKCYNVCAILNQKHLHAERTGIPISTSPPPLTIVYSYPVHHDNSAEKHHDHVSNMLILIEDHKTYISNFQNPTFCLFDVTIPATYFIAKVESHIYMVVTYDCKKTLEDSNIKLFEILVQELRNWTIFDNEYPSS